MTSASIGGTVVAGYERIREAFGRAQADDPGGAQLCVIHRGRTVADLWTTNDALAGTDFDGDRLVYLRSTSKAILFTVMALLVDRGLLDVEAPIVRYWPGFGHNGKDRATVADAMTHTAGVPVFPSSSGIGYRDHGDYERCVRAIEAAVPLWEPGSNRGLYHALTVGYIGDEIVRRITGISAGEVFRREISRPLGLDVWVGLPPEQEHRFAPCPPVDLEDPPSVEEVYAAAGIDIADPLVIEIMSGFRSIGRHSDYYNTRAGWWYESFGGNALATARGLAGMFAAAIGAGDGPRILSREVVDFVRQPRNRHLPPLPAMRPLLGDDPVDIGLGFVLGPVPGAFGHPGAGGVQGFAVPDRGLAVAYLCTASPSAEAVHARETAWLSGLDGIA